MTSTTTATATAAREKLDRALLKLGFTVVLGVSLSIFQRVGGFVGTALVAVVLAHQVTAQPTSPATGFGHPFWVVIALIVVGILAAFRPPALPVSKPVEAEARLLVEA